MRKDRKRTRSGFFRGSSCEKEKSLVAKKFLFTFFFQSENREKKTSAFFSFFKLAHAMQVAALSSSRAALPVASLSTRNGRSNHRGLSTSMQPSTSSPLSSSTTTCAWRIGGGGGTQGAPVRLVSPAPPRAPLSLTSQQTAWLVIAQVSGSDR